MIKKSVATYAFLLLGSTIFSSPVLAQRAGNANAAAGGQPAAGGGPTLAGLTPDAAFTEVQRGATVGSTAGTGQGFGIGVTASPQGGRTTGGGGFGGFGGVGGLGGFGGMNNLLRGGQTGSQASQPAIRTRLRSAVEVAPVPSSNLQQTANSRLQRLPGNDQLRGVNVTVDGRTAVVDGVVPDDRSRRMSELLLRLEPGVSRIENRVTVSP